MKFDLLKKVRKEKRDFTRVAQRFGCQIDASMVMVDRMLGYEGRVVNFSAGGAMFRPKLAYLMDRRDIPVVLTVGGAEMFGRLMRTTPGGFGIKFDEPLEEEQLLALLSNDRTRKESDEIEFFVD